MLFFLAKSLGGLTLDYEPYEGIIAKNPYREVAGQFSQYRELASRCQEEKIGFQLPTDHPNPYLNPNPYPYPNPNPYLNPKPYQSKS